MPNLESKPGKNLKRLYYVFVSFWNDGYHISTLDYEELFGQYDMRLQYSYGLWIG